MYRCCLLFCFLFAAAVAPAQEPSITELLRLANAGEAGAQNEVGAYYSAVGGKKNLQTAISWLTKSAEQGNALGACNLGYHYGEGRGVKKSLLLMVMWVSIGETLDPLRCASERAVKLKPTDCDQEFGWFKAVIWLKAHPTLKNNFKQQPWLNDPDPEVSSKCHN